ncbi:MULTISPECIES: sigma 54-interacting transcriptional regulator [unclassified Agarivorans]|uniref:sigma 54-interacting transcriptional regulator n=1 Tax=unclassified Agarivorans TaxID=2636026 RepID=UPI003D7E56F2
MKDILEQNIVGHSYAIKRVIKAIRTQAVFPTPVIITGETGTGKELAARGLHYSGGLSSRPFIALNCSTFNDDLFVSELFGHKKGSFTDAKTDRQGLLAAAEGGTLFLDEIDSLSLKSQATLLRFLQEKEFRPVGSNDTCKASVRLVTATNCDLAEQITKGCFREDLYYRLLILTIHMPPLRERIEDMPELIEHFLSKFDSQYQLGRNRVSERIMHQLCQHNWPGNVRELENTLHRLYLTAELPLIDNVEYLLFASKTLRETQTVVAKSKIATEPENFDGISFADAKRQTVEAFELAFVKHALVKCNGNITKAASLCGKERRAFGKLVKKYNISKNYPDLGLSC